KFLILGGLLLASPAFAQSGEGTGSGSAAGAPAVGEAVEGTATVAWPAAIIDRPFNLPKAGIAAYGDINIPHFSFGSGMTAKSSTLYGLHIGGAYGVN